MQTEGTLTKWNDDRGFGFITPKDGGQNIFVHISSFPRDGRRPQVGETLFFQVRSDKEGKKKAVDVIRPGSPPLRSQSTRKPRPYKRSSGFSPLLSIVVIIAIIGFVLVRQYGPTKTLSKLGLDQFAGNVSRDASQDSLSNYQCDGRTYCSEMTSCEEAKYFLKNCPGVKMDGNHDGIPCEQQWCTGFFGN